MLKPLSEKMKKELKTKGKVKLPSGESYIVKRVRKYVLVAGKKNVTFNTLKEIEAKIDFIAARYRKLTKPKRVTKQMSINNAQWEKNLAEYKRTGKVFNK